MWPWLTGLGIFVALLAFLANRELLDRRLPGLATGVGLFGLLLSTVVPSFTPGSLYLPQVLIYPRGLLHLTVGTVPSAVMLLGALRGIRSTDRRSARRMRVVAYAFLTVTVVILLGASEFYAKFGTYPGTALVRDFVAAPRVFVAYTKSGASKLDVEVLALAVPLLLGVIVILVNRVWRERPSSVSAAVTAVVGLGLLWMSQYGGWLARTTQDPFLVTEHSLPSTKYSSELLTLFDGNRIEAARPYVPAPQDRLVVPTFSAPRHVLLVIAECLRADHLPAYGYARNTTPFIQSEADRWQSFPRAYAHGPRTSDSLPVLFNSQYFAAVDRNNEGAEAFWQMLQMGGVRSAFLSAGAMEWGGLTRGLALSRVDHTLTASNVEPELRQEMTSAGFDYAVDDAIPMAAYAKLLAGQFANERSFVTLHLVGSHYPFYYADGPDPFLPSLRKTDDLAASSGALIPPPGRRDDPSPGGRPEATNNSYDNSIVHIDRFVRQAVDVLRGLGLADDSVIIVTADHGESLGEHRTFFHGTTLYDEQVHVPLLIRVGAALPSVRDLLEQRRSHVVGQVDLVPTVVQLLTGGPPSRRPFEGVSLLSDYRKPYELLLFRGIGEKVAFVTDARKYIFDVPGLREEEYSVAEDPRELENLSPSGVQSISQFLKDLRARGVLGGVSAGK